MRGFSGSGKSTRAREIAKETDALVVCRDDLRMMLLGSYWTGKRQDEDRVTLAEEAQVTNLLFQAVPVVVDATHLNPPYLRKWARLATRIGVGFEVVDVHADVEECQRRVYKRWQDAQHTNNARYVDPKIVDRQAKQWPAHRWPIVTSAPFMVEPVDWDSSWPEAIICDIDGTLAHMTGRSPYDYSRVIEDDLDTAVVGILEDYKLATANRGTVLIVSGRDHTCRKETLEWLNKYSVPFDKLLMRDANAVDGRGNKLPDYIVKYDIFNEHIRGKYNVKFVLDDRTQVVDMWRKLGLKCLQVQPGDF